MEFISYRDGIGVFLCTFALFLHKRYTSNILDPKEVIMIEYNAAGMFQMLAKTMYGLEDVLTTELQALGAQEIEPGRRLVSFVGDQRLLYRANLHLRTALRILVPIVQFEAGNADEIYQYLYDHVEWDRYLTSRTTFAFDTVVYSEVFTHSKFVAYRAKDAISDYFTDRKDRRPNVSVSDPDVRFHIHISDKTVTLALDASGESLHKRGYRVGQNDAPISEVLAAGILLRAGWEGQCDLLDPMCGSGTFLTEGALIALGIPPGIFRNSFAFEKWNDFDADLWDEIVEEWEEKPFEHKIYGSDIDPKSIALSRSNIKKAGVGKYIEVSIQSMMDYTVDNRPADAGILVMNPPYGERMRPDALDELYGRIGSTLKHVFMGWKAWIISGSTEDGLKSVGLKHFHREKFYNGMIECELRGYELFGGKRDEYLRDMSARSEYRSKPDRKPREEERGRAFKVKEQGRASHENGKPTEYRGKRDHSNRKPFDRERGERGGFRTACGHSDNHRERDRENPRRGEYPGDRSFREKRGERPVSFVGNRRFGDRSHYRGVRGFGQKDGDRKGAQGRLFDRDRKTGSERGEWREDHRPARKLFRPRPNHERPVKEESAED